MMPSPMPVMWRVRAGRWAVLVALLVLPACSKSTDTVPLAAFVTVTPVPEAVEAGAPVEVEYRFTRAPGAAALPADGWVFVHAVDSAGMLLWTDDHQPPSPPDSWRDAPVTYRRAMFVPRATPVGQVRLEAGLFSRGDGTRVAMASAAGTLVVAPASSERYVVFGDGWHGAERVEQQQANEWRWSKGDARLSFRRPAQDTVLSLEVDQPVPQVGRQTLEVRAGSELLATLSVDPGTRRVHRVPLPAARLGDGANAEIALHVQPTFVPASVAALGSQDRRELGVRVFNVHVGP